MIGINGQDLGVLYDSWRRNPTQVLISDFESDGEWTIANANTTPVEKISSGDFEAFTDGLADGWQTDSYTGLGVTYAEEAVIVHGGSKAQKVTVADAGLGIISAPSNAFTVTAGRRYKASIWLYGDGINKLYPLVIGADSFVLGETPDARYIYNPDGVATPAAWTEYVIEFVALDTYADCRVNVTGMAGGGQIFYIDDVSVQEIPTGAVGGSDIRHGSHVLAVTNAGNTAVTVLKEGTWDFSSHHFQLWMKVDNCAAGLSGIYVQMATDWSNYSTARIDWVRDDGWFCIAPHREWFEYEKVGSVNWANITAIQFLFSSLPGQTVTVYFDDFRAIQTFLFPLLTIELAGHLTNYTVCRPKMDEYGYKGAIGVPVDQVDTAPQYLTSAQIRMFSELGWDVICRTNDNDDLTTLGPAVIHDNLTRPKELLANLGSRRGTRFFSYPYGTRNKADSNIIAEVSQQYAMSMVTFNETVGATNAMPLPDNYWVNTATTDEELFDSLDLAGLEAAVDRLVTYNGWMVVSFGSLSTPALISDFEDFIDYVASKGTILVVTYSDVYDNFLDDAWTAPVARTTAERIDAKEYWSFPDIDSATNSQALIDVLDLSHDRGYHSLYLPEGTYLLAAWLDYQWQQTPMLENINLEGVPGKTILKLDPASPYINPTYDGFNYGFLRYGSNLRLYGVVLDGSKDEVDLTGFTGTSVYLLCDQYAPSCYGHNNITLDNIEFKNVWTVNREAFGMLLDREHHNIRMYNIYGHHIDGSAITTMGNWPTQTLSYDIVIDGGYFHDCTWNGISIYCTRDCFVTNIKAYNNSAAGINVEMCKNITISNSELYQNYLRGLTLLGYCENIDILNCAIHDNACGLPIWDYHYEIFLCHGFWWQTVDAHYIPQSIRIAGGYVRPLQGAQYVGTDFKAHLGFYGDYTIRGATGLPEDPLHTVTGPSAPQEGGAIIIDVPGCDKWDIRTNATTSWSNDADAQSPGIRLASPEAILGNFQSVDRWEATNATSALYTGSDAESSKAVTVTTTAANGQIATQLDAGQKYLIRYRFKRATEADWQIEVSNDAGNVICRVKMPFRDGDAGLWFTGDLRTLVAVPATNGPYYLRFKNANEGRAMVVDWVEVYMLEPRISMPRSVGSGRIAYTYTLVRGDTGAPIADASMWVTTDVAGTNEVAFGRTNDFGQVLFHLDPGAYYLWADKAGYYFADNPEAITVTE